MRQRRRALMKYALPLGVVGIVAAPALAAGVPVTFAPAASYPLGYTPSFNVVVGDFNGDGIPDAAAGGLSASQFMLAPGSGDGTFGAATAIPAPGGTLPGTVASGDLNGDGKPDLVFEGSGVNGNLVAMNQALGGAFNFTSPIGLGAVPAPLAPGTPALGDLNEDGKLDLVQPANNGNSGDANTVTYRLGNGDGTFQSAQQLFTNPLPGHAALAAAIADVNGDGHLDALATINGGTFLTALGNGDGTFQMPANQASTGTSSPPRWIVVDDLNGDGHADVVVGNIVDTSVLLGNGDGTFGAASVDAYVAGYSVAVADLNGDGVKDLVGADIFTGGAMVVQLGNGDGTFGAVDTFTLPSSPTPLGATVADVNGDGLGDVLSGAYGGQSLVVLINTSVAMPPAVASVAPATGSAGGGTSVTITGTAFTGATAVTFGGVSATSFTINSARSITAVAPPHAAGAVAIEVTTPNGTGTGAGLFTYTGTQTPDSGGGSTPTAATQPTTPGRLSMRMPRTVRGRNLVSTGVVPAGADRVVQTATGGASSTAHAMFGAWATARTQTTCPISTANGRSIFTCTLRLAPGRWTVSTKAMSGTTTVATSSVRVRMKTASRLSVTG